MKNYFVILSLAMIATACQSETKSDENTVKKATELRSNLVYGDTIICDIVLKNPNISEDYLYTSRFDRIAFVNAIFENLYNNKLKAFDFVTDKELSVNDIKEIEAQQGYSRDKISKVQFNEDWAFNKEKLSFEKHVRSVILGYATDVAADDATRYKALFKVNLN
jgi:hypothetical protein